MQLNEIKRLKEEVLGRKEYTSSKNITPGDEKCKKNNTTSEISHEPKITNIRNGVLNNIIEIASSNQLMKEKKPKILKGKG